MPIRTRNIELMDIEKSSVQVLQSGMEELHKRKEEANQMTAASLHAPANQMAVSPKQVPATVAAESIISTCPLPARTTPPHRPDARSHTGSPRSHPIVGRLIR
jgi:hypothetical protein